VFFLFVFIYYLFIFTSLILFLLAHFPFLYNADVIMFPLIKVTVFEWPKPVSQYRSTLLTVATDCTQKRDQLENAALSSVYHFSNEAQYKQIQLCGAYCSSTIILKVPRQSHLIELVQ